MEQTISSSFGEILKIFRKRRRLSQQALADLLGVHRNTISIWERGDFLPDRYALGSDHHLYGLRSNRHPTALSQRADQVLFAGMQGRQKRADPGRTGAQAARETPERT